MVKSKLNIGSAAARGMTVDGGSAQAHYNAGIAESHAFWGVTLDPGYMAHVDVAYNAARAKALIGTQKWYALYNRGNEGYAVWRSFDWPILTPPQEMSYEDIPMRMPYPYNEPDLNGENYDTAALAIGGDDVRTLLFWNSTISTENPTSGF